jgi:hypothetical protein
MLDYARPDAGAADQEHTFGAVHRCGKRLWPVEIAKANGAALRGSLGQSFGRAGDQDQVGRAALRDESVGRGAAVSSRCTGDDNPGQIAAPS